MGKQWKQSQTIFSGSKFAVDDDCSLEIKRCLLLGRKAMTNLDSVLKKKRHHFANKGPYSQSYGFSSSHTWMWELDHKEGWVPKNWSFQTLVLEKTLESPLNSKETKPVNPKGNQPWIFIGKTGAEAEVPIIGCRCEEPTRWKRPYAGKDWGQEEKGATEDAMVGWHHHLNGHEFEQAPGDGGQGSLVCCSPWSHRELDMT